MWVNEGPFFEVKQAWSREKDDECENELISIYFPDELKIILYMFFILENSFLFFLPTEILIWHKVKIYLNHKLGEKNV